MTSQRGRATVPPRPARRTPWVRITLSLALGALLLAGGGFLIATARPVQITQVDGYLSGYQEILAGSSYVRNDVRLAGDPRTYTLDRTRFQPALPDQLQQGERVRFWVDDGTSHILALALYDANGLNPVLYTTPDFADVTAAAREQEVLGGVLSAAGLVLLLGLVIWLLWLRTSNQINQSNQRIPAPRPANGAHSWRAGASRPDRGIWYGGADRSPSGSTLPPRQSSGSPYPRREGGRGGRSPRRRDDRTPPSPPRGWSNSDETYAADDRW